MAGIVKFLTPQDFASREVAKIRFIMVNEYGVPNTSDAWAFTARLRRLDTGDYWDEANEVWVDAADALATPGCILAPSVFATPGGAAVFTGAGLELDHEALSATFVDLVLHLTVFCTGTVLGSTSGVTEIRFRDRAAVGQIATPADGTVANPVESVADLLYALKVFVTHNRLINDEAKQEQFMQEDGTTVAMSFDLKDAGNLPSVREVFKKERDI